MGQFYVYAIMIAGQPAYVGKGKGRRAWVHLGPACKNTRLKALIAEARAEGIDPCVEILDQGLNEGDAYRLERRLIHRLKDTLANSSFGQRSHNEQANDQCRYVMAHLMSEEQAAERGAFAVETVKRVKSMCMSIMAETANG